MSRVLKVYFTYRKGAIAEVYKLYAGTMLNKHSTFTRILPNILVGSSSHWGEGDC